MILNIKVYLGKNKIQHFKEKKNIFGGSFEMQERMVPISKIECQLLSSMYVVFHFCFHTCM